MEDSYKVRLKIGIWKHFSSMDFFMTDDQTVQIVITKLKPGADAQKFLELSEKMHSWLKNQDGFVSYELYSDETKYADRIVWKSRDDAEHVNHLFVASDIFKEMELLIDPDYMGFLGRKVTLNM